jgi:hypothetical protein
MLVDIGVEADDDFVRVFLRLSTTSHSRRTAARTGSKSSSLITFCGFSGTGGAAVEEELDDADIVGRAARGRADRSSAASTKSKSLSLTHVYAYPESCTAKNTGDSRSSQ